MRSKFSSGPQARSVALGGMIAAVYVVLTLVASGFGLASGAIQVRFSEALCLLPCLTPAAVPGLAIGCLLANLVTGSPIWDILFGTLATLLGAIGSRLLRRRSVLRCLPPVLANALIIPPVLIYAYGVPQGFLFLTVTIAIGEILSAGVLGSLLLRLLEKNKKAFE